MTDGDIERLESDRFMREEAELAHGEAGEPVRLGQAVSEWAAERPIPYTLTWQAEALLDHTGPEAGS